MIGAVLTLPAVNSLIILDRYTSKRILHHDVRLSLNYITISSIILASLGIVSLLMFLLTGVTTVMIEKYPYAIYQQLLSIFTP